MFLKTKKRRKASFCFAIKNSSGWTVLLAGVKRGYGCRLQWLCHFAVKPSPSAGLRSNLKQGFALWFSSNFRVWVKTKAGTHPALILTIKNSLRCTTLELFVQALYEKIVDIENYKTVALIKKIK